MIHRVLDIPGTGSDLVARALARRFAPETVDGDDPRVVTSGDAAPTVVVLRDPVERTLAHLAQIAPGTPPAAALDDADLRAKVGDVQSRLATPEVLANAAVIARSPEAALSALAAAYGWRDAWVLDEPTPLPPVDHALRVQLASLGEDDRKLLDRTEDRAPDAPAAWTWDPARAASGTLGWRPPQRHPEHGWHRWTGRAPVSALELDGPATTPTGPLTLEIETFADVGDGVLGGARVALDGVLLDHRTEVVDGRVVVHADIPSVAQAPRTLVLTMPRTEPIPETTDELSGVAVAHATIRAAA